MMRRTTTVSRCGYVCDQGGLIRGTDEGDVINVTATSTVRTHWLIGIMTIKLIVGFKGTAIAQQ